MLCWQGVRPYPEYTETLEIISGIIHFRGGIVMKKASFIVLCIALVALPVLPGHGEARSKKMYVAAITAQGAGQDIANRIRERITLAIFEKYGTEYYVVNDDDIKASYQQAEKMMVQGSGDAMLAQIAGAIDADEIIHGTLSRDNGRLRLSVKNLLRNRTSSTLSTKSMVLVNFFETQADWYAAEAAYKLMNPRYTINEKNIPVFDSKVKLADIKITNGKNLDISIMQFASSDESVSAILSYLKELVGKGDESYGAADYPAAREQYQEVLDKVASKLTADKQARMKSFTDGVKKRMGSAWALDIKKQIEAVDALVAGKTEMDEKSLADVLKNYLAVRSAIKKVPEDYSMSVRPLDESLTARADNVRAALANHRERAGNTAYAEYRFEDAEKLYREAAGMAGRVENAALRGQLTDRYNARAGAARKTGEGYLYSRVQALCDRAELANVKNDNGGARDALEQARKLMEKSQYKNTKVNTLYKTTATVIKGDTVWQTRYGDIEYIQIPGGSFMMGSIIKHQVTLSAFQIGRFEVTQQEYQSVMGTNPSKFKDNARNPVECISWYDAVEFCNKLSEKQGLKPYYSIDKSRKDPLNKSEYDRYKYTVTILGGNGYRLPTQAEWEYACRAGTTTKFCYGNRLDSSMANFGENNKKTLPVGSFKPNAWGLYDMHGNVDEWCFDWHDFNDSNERSPARNPVNLDGGKYRVVRGGNWHYSLDLGSGDNGTSSAHFHLDYSGFRLVRSLP